MHIDVDVVERQALCLRFGGEKNLQTFILGGQ